MHPCERCKEARQNDARQGDTTDPGKVQRSKANRSNAGQAEMYPNNSKASRWIVATSWSWKGGKKESLDGGRPFEVLHGPNISSGKYEHSPIGGLCPYRIQTYHHRMPTIVVLVKRRIHVTDEENEQSEDDWKGPRFKFQCNGTGCMLPHGTVTCMKRGTGR